MYGCSKHFSISKSEHNLRKRCEMEFNKCCHSHIETSLCDFKSIYRNFNRKDTLPPTFFTRIRGDSQNKSLLNLDLRKFDSRSEINFYLRFTKEIAGIRFSILLKHNSFNLKRSVGSKLR